MRVYKKCVQDNPLSDYPELISEWDDERDYLTISSGSEYQARWKCRLDHIWKSSVKYRVKSGYPCPYCFGKKVWSGFNDLATTHSDVASEWFDDFDVKLSSSGSKKIVLWKCKTGHIVEQAVRERVRSGCTVCSGRRVLIGSNDLATTHPDLIREWGDGSSPTTVSEGSHKKVKWDCRTCGNSWETQVRKRTQRGYGCPYCSGSTTLAGFNDLRTLRPDLVREWDFSKNVGIYPENFTCGSNKKVWWICSHYSEHRWQAFIGNRALLNTGCPKCAKHVSRQEVQLFEYIRTLVNLDVQVIQSDRKAIAPKELDIYIPALNLAFEFNGIYWHSDEVIVNRKGISSEEYHALKREAAKEQGISLFFVWEDDWLSQRDLVEQAVFNAVVNQVKDSPLLSVLSKS